MDTTIPFGQAGAQRAAAIEEEREQEEAERADYFAVQAARREDEQANQSNRGRTGTMNAQEAPRNGAPPGEGDSPNFEEFLATGQAAVRIAQYKNISEYTTSERDKKHTSACKHFDFYLAKHRKVPWTHKTIPYEQVNDDIMGGYHAYLAEDAHKYQNVNLPLLMLKTADGYSSSVKMALIDRFADKPTPPCLESEKWTKARNSMTRAIIARCTAKGEKTSNPKEAASEEDLSAMAQGCVWLGNEQGAEFMALESSMVTYAGRGSEVGNSRKEHLTSEMKNEHHIRYPRLNQYLKRDKNNMEQNCSSYLHRVSVCVVLFFPCGWTM
jgi:hypothetical protein